MEYTMFVDSTTTEKETSLKARGWKGGWTGAFQEDRAVSLTARAKSSSKNMVACSKAAGAPAPAARSSSSSDA